MTEQLKPCPFCDKEVNLHVSLTYADYLKIFSPNYGVSNVCGASNVGGKTLQ